MRGVASRQRVAVIVVSVVINMLTTASVLASGSWTSGTFTFGDESLRFDTTDCTNKQVKIGGDFSTTSRDVCVYERPNWRYGFYTQVTGPPYAPHYENFLVVGIGADRGMYKVTNVGYSASYQVVHLPGTNDFMYNRLISGFTNNHNLHIARDFPSKLERTTTGGETIYRLADDSYEPLIPNNEGMPATTGAVGVSQNGRWMAVEVMNAGLALVNTETQQLHFFSNYKHWYGVGSDAQITFVISNDGKLVATFDFNIQPKVYTLSEECVLKSDQLDAISEQLTTYRSCPDDGGRLWTALEEKFGSLAKRRVAGEFSYENDTLYFNRSVWTGEGIKNTYGLPLRAGNYQPDENIDYLALGDSYASGEGDTEQSSATGKKHYRSYTDNEEDLGQGRPREKCHISTRSYPYILSNGMQLGEPRGGPNTKWQTVACSGARVYDVDTQNSADYKGQGKGGSEGGRPRLENFDSWRDLKSGALNEFIPGREKQIEFVKKYKPKVITLTMGGNDVGFGDKIRSCIWVGVCGFTSGEGKARLAREILDSYDKLRILYQQLHEAANGQAKIYILGYPQFVNDNEPPSCGANVGSLNHEERKMIKNSVTFMNNVIEQAAKSAGVKYIDIEDSLDGGKLCDDGQEYVTGIAFWGDSETQESFHPNAKGHFNIAMAVWDEVNNESLLHYDICPSTEQNSCPDSTATKDAIEMPPYFESISEVKTEYANLTSGEAQKGTPLTIMTGSFILRPSSSANITIYSDPTNLGNFTVDANGSLNVNLGIPNALPVGYHTLIVTGETYSGEPIELEQVVLIKSSNPKDIDDDGRLDSKQPCGPFVIAANKDTDMDGIDDGCDSQIGSAPKSSTPATGSVNRNENHSSRIDKNNDSRGGDTKQEVDSGQPSDKDISQSSHKGETNSERSSQRDDSQLALDSELTDDPQLSAALYSILVVLGVLIGAIIIKWRKGQL